MTRKIFIITALSFVLFSITSCGKKPHKNPSTVSVSGIGTVLAQPDMIQVHINFSQVAPTTQQARLAVEQTMQQIISILQEENVEEHHIQTISLNFHTEYEWRNGRAVRIGQRAQQTIAVTVNDIINNPERFPNLLDRITAINRVAIHNIRFDIEDKTEFFRQSRELAFQRAYEKANHYASLANRTLGKVQTITEGRSQDIAQARARTMNVYAMPAVEMQRQWAGDSAFPTGEREITTEIVVVFTLK